MIERDAGANVVEVTDPARQYGNTMALDGISLRVQPGLVYGLVGAGKTTLIKHLLGVLRAQQGSVRVFGMGPGAKSCRGAAANRLLIGRPRPARVDAD